MKIQKCHICEIKLTNIPLIKIRLAKDIEFYESFNNKEIINYT